MKRMLRSSHLTWIVSFLVGVVLVLFGPAVANGQPAPSPGATPPGGAITQYSPGGPRPMASDQGVGSVAKQSRAEALYQQLVTKRAQAQGAGAVALANTYASSNLAEPWYAQVNGWYCGAATTVMVADYKGIGWSGTQKTQQNAAAKLLGMTQSTGTAFYGYDNVPNYPGRGMYPVADVLNYQLYLHGKPVWYYAAPLPGSPSQSDQNQFVYDLIADIYYDNYAEADNQWSIVNYQLPYQPNEAIQHW